MAALRPARSLLNQTFRRPVAHLARTGQAARAITPLCRFSSTQSHGPSNFPSDPTTTATGAPFGSPFSQSEYDTRRATAHEFLRAHGWDLGSAVEQPVVWGDCDMMGHLNNVQTLRYFETSRMQFIRALLPELPAAYEASLCQGKEVVPGSPGVILGSVSARYKRPVYYPDTLLVAHRVSAVKPDRFILESVAFSMQQNCAVTVGEADMVCYSYGQLKKMTIPEPLKVALEKRMTTKV